MIDELGKNIRLAPSCLTVEGRLASDPTKFSAPISRVQLGRLINGYVNTKNERHMWLTSFPLVSDSSELACLDLTISYSTTSKSNKPAEVKIWNYGLDKSKCVKEFVCFLF